VPVTLRERMIVTAAHCLPSLPTPHPWAQDSRNWKLLAPLGERPSIVATCRFVDPVADIALLGSPDNQEMYEEAEAYEALTDAATALPIGFLPSKFAAELNGWLLSLDGAWFSCTVNYRSDGGLWTNATRAIEGGMSGSPIVADNGAAVGVLSCSNEAEMGRRLNTDDPVLAGQVLRLLLSRAIEQEKLKGGIQHPAWIAYGGPIARATKSLLQRLTELAWGEYELKRKPMAARLGLHVTVLDFLTDHEKPATVAAAWRRHRGRRRGRYTPMSRSWQFRRIGRMIHSHRQCFYGRAMIGYRTISWRLVARNRVEAEELVKPAVEARRRVSETARSWRECPTASSEAKAALTALLAAQRRFRDALLAVGAKRSKGWAEVVKALNEPPFDENSRPNPEGARTWFVELLRKNPERPPRPLETVKDRLGLLEEATERFKVSMREARRSYERAQDITGIRAWSTAHRGKAR
jgi:hypothetical protein